KDRADARLEVGEAPVGAGEVARCAFAHMADAEGIEETVEGYPAARFDGAKQVADRGLAPARAVLDLREARLVPRLKGEDVGGIADVPRVPEGLHLLGAEAFDVEGGAGHEMAQALLGLGGTDEPAR